VAFIFRAHALATLQNAGVDWCVIFTSSSLAGLWAAFRRFEAQGLAVSEPRRGVRVVAFDLLEVREVAEMRAACTTADFQSAQAGFLAS
jgi:hypothetical protein